jgi:hypothetical protein
VAPRKQQNAVPPAPIARPDPMIPLPPKKVDILPVAPVRPVVIHEFIPIRVSTSPEPVSSIRQEPEVPRRVEVPPKLEAKKPLVEEKASIPEEKPSEPSKKRKVRYEGEGGRIHTEAQIDEILDFYLMTGELPVYVSERQRYDYRHHERLPERKELLEGRGIQVNTDLSSSTRRAKNVIPINGTKVQRKRSTGS